MESVIRTRLSNELKEKFVKLAEKQGVTASELLRKYIESFVAKAAN